MKKTFLQAVSEGIKRFDPGEKRQDESDYLRDPARLTEAQRVAPLADAIAVQELWGDGRPLGQFGMKFLVPPLGELLQRRLKNADLDQRDSATSAVLAALGQGYAGFMAIEPKIAIEVRREDNLKGVWDHTIHNFRSDAMKQMGIPERAVDTIESSAEDALVTELEAAGVLGRRKFRVLALGRYYGQAGVLLRAGQTDFVTDEGLDFLTVSVMPDIWPFTKYVKN
jgi:hypothetical protein